MSNWNGNPVINDDDEDQVLPCKSNALGFIEPLKTLSEEFTYSKGHQRKIHLMAEKVKATHWRRVRGDGNCFYRALGTTLIERMLLKGGDIEKFHDFIHHAMHLARRTEKVDGTWHGLLQRDEEGYRRRAGRDFLHYTQGQGPLDFWNEELNDKTMDHGIIALIRLAIYQYAKENGDMEVSGMPLEEAAIATSGASTFDDWLDNEIRTDGQEAESLAMILAASALNVRFMAVQLDRSMDTPLERYEFLPIGRSAPIGSEHWDAILLFKPGHYDILYESPIGEQLYALQNENAVIENCSYWRCKPKCPICRCDIETYEDVLYGISPDCSEIFHRSCFKSMVEHCQSNIDNDKKDTIDPTTTTTEVDPDCYHGEYSVRCPVCLVKFTKEEIDKALSSESSTSS